MNERTIAGMPLYTALPRGTRVLTDLLHDLSDLQYWFYFGGLYSGSERKGGMSDDQIMSGQRAAQQAVIRTLERLQDGALSRPGTDPMQLGWVPVAVDGHPIAPIGRNVDVDILYSDGTWRPYQRCSALRRKPAPDAPTPTHWRPHKPKKDPNP